MEHAHEGGTSCCEGGKMGCKCMHHSLIPLLIIVLGVIFLLGALGVLSSGAVSIIWPILVIVGGLMKLGFKKCKCC